jgi:hypothetical protein
LKNALPRDEWCEDNALNDGTEPLDGMGVHSPEIIEHSWVIFRETWENEDSDELNHSNDDAEFHPQMTQQDLEDVE